MAALNILSTVGQRKKICAPAAPSPGSRSYDRIVSALLRAGVDPFASAEDLLYSLRFKPSGLRRPLIGKSTKVILGEKYGVKTAITYLAPSLDSGTNLCPFASPGCIEGCLKDTGRMGYASNGIVRLKKSLYYRLFPVQFLEDLAHDIAKLERAARRDGFVPAVRLNGTSDILWEKTGLLEKFPGVKFYDYTKAPLASRPHLPANYHLTYSVSELPHSMEEARRWLAAGRNAAVVVSSVGGTNKTHAKRAAADLIARDSWEGFPTIDGDQSDVRFNDEPGSWVVLYAKGGSVRDSSGFVRRIQISEEN